MDVLVILGACGARKLHYRRPRPRVPPPSTAIVHRASTAGPLQQSTAWGLLNGLALVPELTADYHR